jgi:hypothetical protein
VTNGALALDARGWPRLDDFLRRYSRAHRAILPAWRYRTIPVDDAMGWEFCREHGSRHPSQFPQDPVPRATRFLNLTAFPREITRSQPATTCVAVRAFTE